jgi:hypothetical protein
MLSSMLVMRLSCRWSLSSLLSEESGSAGRADLDRRGALPPLLLGPKLKSSCLSLLILSDVILDDLPPKKARYCLRCVWTQFPNSGKARGTLVSP